MEGNIFEAGLDLRLGQRFTYSRTKVLNMQPELQMTGLKHVQLL